ncbi:DUF4870 domain-containing protein [Staphylococcus pettenkoferi]|uniref:DUF4870 domain-containing protein n=1 Tax=Staphylococcus pettenkoferi TaxID=170573 RepID=UPI00066AAFA6|nr:DUF4870 domain-containing protein [Staphylococcus pettenkoferi]MCI2803341.1 DUF4870 domain-containing protein [Staphylococcus pettenkoferi]MCY1584516.1 DUF4870 domain-containing protein [Staphylococcus pettenkoferi]MCY1615680.1 DUF4870 domain-containing protein [Staphylococcus pettenkoferi]MCY1626819.1 DUF4870 domain-containing protein [Staphylococcus pettenkoferi]UIK48592.1 DUF4870 domain-containing protein [Staphylococcus pettenkoferi]
MTEQQETSLQNETDRSKPGQKNTGQSKTQKPQTQPDIKERLIGVGLYLSILVFGYIVMKIYNKLTYVDTSLDMYKNFFISIIIGFFVAFVISLVQWLFIRKQSTFVNQIGKAYFNFCISIILWTIFITLALGLALLAVGKVIDTQELEPSIFFIIFSAPVFMLFFVFLFLIFSLIGAVMAGFGKVFHVPMSFKILR